MNEPAAQLGDDEDLSEEEDVLAVGHLWRREQLTDERAMRTACERVWHGYLRASHGRGIVSPNAGKRRAPEERGGRFELVSLADEGPRMAELRRVVDARFPSPAPAAAAPPNDPGLFGAIVATMRPATETPKEEKHVKNNNDDITNLLKKEGPLGVTSIAQALGVTASAAYQACVKLGATGAIASTGGRMDRKWALAGQAVPAPSKSTPSPRRAPAVKAAVVTAAHGGDHVALSSLRSMRAKAQAKVDAIDELLTSLGAP